MNNNMINFDEYIRQGEPLQREKGYAWQTAIGLQAVDGLKPSDYLIETARKDIEGEITIDEAEQLIRSYYQSKIAHTPEDAEIHEADIASTNIRRLLTEKTFAFTLVGLTSIHRRIFDGVFKFAGQIRDYNITKKSGCFGEIRYCMFLLPISVKRSNTTWNKNASSTIQKWTEMD